MIPTEIGNLTKLKELTLADNLFEGQIPSEIGNLSNPETLLLNNNNNNNRLLGSVNESIINLPKLKNLDFKNNPKKINIQSNTVSQTSILP